MSRLLRRMRSTSYGWWVAYTASMNSFFTSGVHFQGSSAIIAAVQAEFGWTTALASGVASFGRFGGGLLGPVEGILTDRIGSAWMMLGGLILMGLGLIWLSQIDGPVPYYMAFLMLSIGVSAGGFVPATSAVARWLPERRATGISMVLAGSSAGALLVPLMALGITNLGWRPTMVIIGIIALILAPIFWRIMSLRGHHPPEQASRASEQTGGNAPSADDSFTAKEALRARAFWIISGTHTLANLSTATVSAHIILHLTHSGLSFGAASLVPPIYASIAFFSQLAGGVIGDRMDKRIPLFVSLTLQATAIVALTFVTSFASAMAFAVLWGLGFGARTPILHAMRGDYFGSRAFGAILGLSSVPMQLGMMAAPVLVGFAFDLQGTYRWAFLVVAAACYCAAFLILLASRPRRATPAASSPDRA